ncbi:hypothetical protein [Mesorhizobium loti]|uniref:hypothetical protein n=1 Tax=Rhizobium loti TaxID=381 RepID=UPI0003F8BE45|nr:hypothetical protein [Mesorhizobium loti]
MRYEYSAQLRDDVNSAVLVAFNKTGIVNITAVAERVRISNLAENVALEDIEYLVLQAAQLLGAAIEFDGLALLGNGVVEDDDSAIASFDLRQPASLQ